MKPLVFLFVCFIYMFFFIFQSYQERKPELTFNGRNNSIHLKHCPKAMLTLLFSQKQSKVTWIIYPDLLQNITLVHFIEMTSFNQKNNIK